MLTDNRFPPEVLAEFNKAMDEYEDNLVAGMREASARNGETNEEDRIPASKGVAPRRSATELPAETQALRSRKAST